MFPWTTRSPSTLDIPADLSTVHSDWACALPKSFLKTGVLPGAQEDAQLTVIPPSASGTRGPVPDPYDVPTGAVAGDVSTTENIV
ncbi:hypothetical protein FB451DRAFT_1222532 [Mycena latifolia]|nr:hypothetical protein FB451DRAFT_1222532 [Mycena latifolia]